MLPIKESDSKAQGPNCLFYVYIYDTYKTDKQFYVDLSHIHMKNGKPWV